MKKVFSLLNMECFNDQAKYNLGYSYTTTTEETLR